MPPLPPAEISVTLPVNQAVECVKRVLFQPFDLARWFVIGFSAWLAYLGQRGGGVHFNVPGSRGGGAGVQQEFERAREYVVDHLYWIVPVTIAVALLVLALWIVIVWLSSRGRFMFLHCVARNRAEVRAPWNEFVREGNSLFWFRVVLGLVVSVPMLALVVFLVILGFKFFAGAAPEPGTVLLAVGLGFLLAVVAVIFWVVMKLTSDFVVPIMYLRRSSCLQGWSVLASLLRANLGHFVLYFLFQIVLALATFVVVVTAVLVTCCIAGCLLAIPYLGTVFLLPILVFRRAYSLYYLAQYGAEFNAFSS